MSGDRIKRNHRTNNLVGDTVSNIVKQADLQAACDESGDAWLLTPGPLTTSLSVKRAMLRDLGSRDRELIAVTHLAYSTSDCDSVASSSIRVS